MPSSAAISAPSWSAGLQAFLAVDAEADESGDLAAELDRLVLREVAEVRHLHFARCILVHCQRVDDSHRVALPELLQLLEDLTVELGLGKAQHDVAEQVR